MYKDILTNISGIEWYPIIALIFFFIFFISMVIWVIKIDKNKLEEISMLPLEDSSFEKIDGEFNNER